MFRDYSFPIAAVTNHHQFTVLKPQKLILPQFWSPVSGKVRAGLPSSLGYRGKSAALPVLGTRALVFV